MILALAMGLFRIPSSPLMVWAGDLSIYSLLLSYGVPAMQWNDSRAPAGPGLTRDIGHRGAMSTEKDRKDPKRGDD